MMNYIGTPDNYQGTNKRYVVEPKMMPLDHPRYEEVREAMNDPFRVPETPFFDVWPPYNDEPKVSPDVQAQADLYTRTYFPDGNLRDSKRKQRLSKKMKNRRNRRG